MREGTVRLADGRVLGYGEHGAADGSTVLYFHGVPGSRHLRMDPAAVSASGVRLITVERPGYGLSDPKPGRTLADFATDVAELADKLGLERFAVAGASAGAPYALAVGLGLPGDVTGVVLICGLGPTFDHPEFDDQLNERTRPLMPLVRQNLQGATDLVREVLAGERARYLADPDGFWEAWLDGWPDADAAMFRKEEDMWRACLRATYLHEDTQATDIMLDVGPWNLDLGAMQVPVRAWHGTADAVAPLGLTEIAVSRAGGTLVALDGEPHLINRRYHQAVLDWAADPTW